MGDSSKVQVGDQIVGIGNAGGTGVPSSAGGNVTALNQSITATDESDNAQEQLSGLIAVDANIQPGDSGGSLVDAQGHVVGVDTAASQSFSIQTNSGQGFAIPINQALSIAHQVESGQTTSTVHIGQTAFLGVFVDVSASSGSGATLKSAIAGGPAAKAGLGAGDVITTLGGQTVASSADLTKALVPYHPGDKVQVGWSDSTGVTHTATISLGNGPAA
jgi:S1-C subfamily serine protease